MAIITKYKIKNESFVQLSTEDRSIILDYPAPVYGKSHSFPSFSSPARPMSFLIRDIQSPDAFFLTNSYSIGCLFLDKHSNIPIFCTSPVFEHILLKYEEYSAMQISYIDEERDKLDSSFRIVNIRSANISKFKKNVVLINFGEIIACGTTNILSKPAGTYIGWSHLAITFENGISLSYVSSYSKSKRLSLAASPISGDYLLVNLSGQKLNKKYKGNIKEGISQFNNIVVGASHAVVIPISFDTFFLEVLIHVFSLLEKTDAKIYAIFPVIFRLEMLIGTQGEWLAERFSRSDEPVAISIYRNFRMLNDFKELDEISCAGLSVVFCNLFYSPVLFDRQTSLFIDSGNGIESQKKNKQVNENQVKEKVYLEKRVQLKVDMSEDEINDEFMIENKKGNVIKATPFIVESASKEMIINLPRDMNAISSSLFLDGLLRNTDRESLAGQQLSFIEKKGIIKKIVESKRIIVDGEWILVPDKGIKMRIKETKIEYKKTN